MSQSDFGGYFHRRAKRFSSFYRSEPVSRLLGRGPIFDRLRIALDQVEQLGAKSVLDVGCGSGPLFAPLAQKGVHVTGLDPAPAMVQLARSEAARFPGLVEVSERGWEDIDEQDTYDAAVALGVFDYVDRPSDLLERMGRAADHVIGSFPAPGLRLELRKIRYGARGVGVHPYPASGFEGLARDAKLRLGALLPLGAAGHVAVFHRLDGTS
ncbi:MAG TPA: class I SAM-dependent methyltransferase [Acidimicrobiales bacterium]|nr:class I SAM-dependent methyltransferase [Acidimicrobiales bacterium]